MRPELRPLAANAFADDLSIITNTAKNLQIQADKTTYFLEWSKMTANNGKCALTGALLSNRQPYNINNRTLARNQLKNIT